jgi:hypothetical protein
VQMALKGGGSMHRGLFWREGDNVSNGEWKKKMKTEALNDEKIES